MPKYSGTGEITLEIYYENIEAENKEEAEELIKGMVLEDVDFNNATLSNVSALVYDTSDDENDYLY